MTSAIYTRAALAELFGYADARTFGDYIPTLEQAGFPPPLPIGGRCKRWSKAAVDAWLAGARVAAPPPGDDPNPDDLAAARARLAAKSRQA
jgi:predicted DNA-binding transcriptional regulator AlpA